MLNITIKYFEIDIKMKQKIKLGNGVSSCFYRLVG